MCSVVVEMRLYWVVGTMKFVVITMEFQLVGYYGFTDNEVCCNNHGVPACWVLWLYFFFLFMSSFNGLMIVLLVGCLYRVVDLFQCYGWPQYYTPASNGGCVWCF
jgi:hypothetical protein